MEIIPVCYCGNKKVFGGIFMSVMSIAKHTDAALDVILLSMDLTDRNPDWASFSDEQISLMEDYLRKKNPESRVRLLDVTELHAKYFDGGKNEKTHYTPFASIRLFLDLLDVPQKIVYLDADIMCCADIREYYRIDISEYEFAATLDVIGRKFFKGNYCNSGVMLLNMEKIRKTGLFAKAREWIVVHKTLMPDQHAIHKSCTAKFVLPYRFNEQRDIRPDTVFKHFCMGYKWYGPVFKSYNHKQWHREKVHSDLKIHDFDDIYAEYDALIENEMVRELIKI